MQNQTRKQAPLGSIPPAIDERGLITIGGRRVATVKHGELRRTFGRHEFFRDGLAFRADILNLALRAGATEIVATQRETKKRWSITMACFREHGAEYTHKRFGRQWFCAFDHWTELGVTDKQMELM